MNQEELNHAARYSKAQQRRRIWKRFVSGVACVVVFCTVYSLILPALTLEEGTYCGLEEHQHEEGCYEDVLVCGNEEGETLPAHEHTESCYTRQRELVCGQEESAGHVHTVECVSAQQVLICENTDPEHIHEDGCYETREVSVCGLAEGDGAHTHTEECYAETDVLTCPLNTAAETTEGTEAPAHTHDESCYEQTLVCELEEHTHSLSCFSNPDADVESADVWERSVSKVKLTGSWGEDLAAIAKTQLGYRESENNYLVNDDGMTVRGYTRYGAWYGDRYAEWSALFAGFCLDYADIPESAVPRGATPESWIPMLSGSAAGYSGYDLYRNRNYTPAVGDIVLLDLDKDGGADHAAIVTESGDGKFTAIVGNVSGQVAEVSYSRTDARILGYAQLPENPNEPEETVPGETGETEPAETRETLPDETVPGETTSGETVPGETVPGETLPGEMTEITDLEGDSAMQMEALLAAALLAEEGSLQNRINMIAALTDKTGTVELDHDYTENLVIPDGTYITLDLKGYTLSPAPQSGTGDRNHVTVFGSLEIIDSVGGGKLANTGASNMRGVTVASGGGLTLTGGTITGYRVSGSGGGIRVEANGHFTMNGGTVSDCSAAHYGGGVYTYDSDQITLSGGTISGSSAAWGGGLAVYHSTTSEDAPFAPANLTLSGNSATYGGGLYAGENIWFRPSGMTVSGNRADMGGGIYFNQYASVTYTNGNTVTGNSAVSDGGGLYFTQVSTRDGSRLDITGGSIANNTAGNRGGGVAFQNAYSKAGAVVNLSGGTVEGNRAQYGGGLNIYRKSAFTLTGGSISGNTAVLHGGGFFLDSASNYQSTFTMTGGEIRGNRVEQQTGNTYGGGGYILNYSAVTLSGGIIAENTGPSCGGGLFVAGNSTVTMEGDMEITANQVSSQSRNCYGAGLLVDGNNGAFTMTGGSIYDNVTHDQRIYGVGLALGTGTHSIAGGKIFNNRALGGNLASGGGISNGGTLTIGGNAEIWGNELNNKQNVVGGGIYGGTIYLRDNAFIHDNTGTTLAGDHSGGGIYCTTLDISDNARISNNTTTGIGGGAFCRKLIMSGGFVTDNRSGGLGGGIYLQNYNLTGYLSEITGGVISGNSGTAGGGIYYYGVYTQPTTGGVLTVTGGSITGNEARTGNGGGIYVNMAARLKLNGGEITGNRAQYGGGVYVDWSSWHTFLDAPEDTQAYSLEVYPSAALRGNEAFTEGRDIYVYAASPTTTKWRQPYFYVEAPQDTASGGWYDERNDGLPSGNINNREEIQAMEREYDEAPEDDKVNHYPETRRYAYTFVSHSGSVAQVEETVYSSVQEAVDAIAAGDCSDTLITMLQDSREDVIIPENLTVTLDLAGHSLSGVAGSVLTVSSDANLTVRDSSDDQTGGILHGRGRRIVENSAYTYGGGACILSGGSLTLESGSFRENSASYGSAIYVDSDASFTMTGGSLTENNGNYYAIYGGLNASAKNVTVTVTGGEITANPCGGLNVYGTGSVVTVQGTPNNRIQITGNGRSSSNGRSAVHIADRAQLICSYTDIKDNTATDNGGGIHVWSGAKATLSHCTVSGNQTSNSGGGIYNYSGTVELSHTDVTENFAGVYGGGIYEQANGSTKLDLLDGARVWDNSAQSQSWDLYLGASSYFCGTKSTMGTAGDTRAAKNMGLPDGLNYWYDSSTNVYYVENGCAESVSWGVPVKPIGYDASTDSLLNAHNALKTNASLTASPSPTENPVAKIGETAYPSITAALSAAKAAEETAVTVELLRDVTESFLVSGGAYAKEITLDLCGHVISAPANCQSVINLNPGSKLTLTDSSAGKTGAVDGSTASNARGVYVNAGSFTLAGGTIRNFTINGDGGGIYATSGSTSGGLFSSQVTLSGGVIDACHATNGGAVLAAYNHNTAGITDTLSMTDGVIRNCTAKVHGGGIYVSFTHYSQPQNHHAAILSGGLIDNCKANGGYGGGIYVYGTTSSGPNHLEIYGITVRNCYAKSYGGGVYVERGGSTAHPFRFGSADAETKLLNNRSDFDGGGAYICSARAGTYVVVENVTLTGNTAVRYYGGAYFSGADLTVKNVVCRENQCQSYAGMGVGARRLEMADCVIADNHAFTNGYYGGLTVFNSTLALPEGAELLENPIHIQNCSITGNQATDCAGLAILTHQNLLMENVTISENTCIGRGGGIALVHQNVTDSCTYTLRNCNIQNNTASSGAGIGEYGNYNMTLVLEGTEISGNHATTYGGGINMTEWNGSSRTAISHLIIGSGTRIHDNSAGSTGGGIRADNINLTILDGAEITGNSSGGAGGGMYFYVSEHATIHPEGEIKLLMTGGDISGNTSVGTGGGISVECTTTTRHTSVEITGGKIRNNHGSSGGGMRLYSYNADNTGSRLDLPVTIGGTAEITGNTASSGGGINGSFGVRLTLKDSARIVGNSAVNYGGGVYMEYSQTTLDQQCGKLYGNSALLGQDAYINFHTSYRSANVHLMDAQEMTGDEIVATGWLDEKTSRTYDHSVTFEPATKVYPFTLVYATAGVAAIAERPDGSFAAFDLVQDAINAIARDKNRTAYTGKLVLVSDTAESVIIPAEADVNLNLAGYTLRGSGSSAITCRGSLTLTDDTGAKAYQAVHVKTGEPGVYAPKQGAVGTVTGHAYQNGGGIYVDGGAVTMQAGRIANCRAGSNQTGGSYGGGGVCVYSGSFTLESGEITNNTAYNGAAVLLLTSSASFTMTGGSITGNQAKTSGAATPNGCGAIYSSNGNVQIFGGTISGNSAGAGGAIFMNYGKVTVSGPDAVIRDNTATNQGGAVYANFGTLNFTEGTMEKNRVTGKMSTDLESSGGYNQSSGGAIYVGYATVNIGGTARITGNSAIRGGAIYQYRGTVNVLGGVITKNTAVLGGGLAQNPLPGVNSTWMHVMGGCVYGNISQRDVGNDLFSRYEGKKDYESDFVGKSLVPHMSVLAAHNMGLEAYNVWKDDLYDGGVGGGNRTGLHIGDGQYLTASIMNSNNLALTADHYDTEIKTIYNPDFLVKAMKVKDITDGTSYFDDGLVHGVRYDDAKEKERSAKDLLDAGLAQKSDETYVLDDAVLNYISYQGKLYEQNQAVQWWPGDDSRGDNRILRTFDNVVYMLELTVEYKDQDHFETGTEHAYQVRFKATLPCGPDKATFANIGSLGLEGYALTTHADENGHEYQVLEGYWEGQTTSAAGTVDKPITVSVYGMENGATFKPTFEAYVVGNKDNQAAPASCASEIITVSAAPSYNVTVDYNNTLTYTSYFDIVTGEEVTEAMYNKSKEEGYTGNEIVYGMMQGYGVILELYNDPTGKGLKGIELPDGPIDFDLHFRGSAYLNGKLMEGDHAAPYIWAYKSNNSNTLGKALNGTVSDRNMNWNDTDDPKQTTHFAYNAAPYNNGGGSNACYNGGSWVVTGSQPAAGDPEAKVHVTVSGYSFDSSGGPTQNSDNSTDSVLSVAAIKAFSTGYVQVLFPVDREALTGSAGGEMGYVEIAMETAVSGLSAHSLTGVTPKREGASDLTESAWKTQLDSLNGYFGRDDSAALEAEGIARQETRYADNYVTRSSGLYIFDGTGNGDSIWKENHFSKEAGGRLTNDAGTGETPIDSTVYVDSYVSFSSGIYDATKAAEKDPLYNAEFWSINGAEYNYMTAINILQKFDASVYTPVGADPVVKQRFDLASGTNSIGGGAFAVNTSETVTNWDWNNHATQSYTLTILYAAKPDGTNWEYRSGEKWDDGGVAEMDQYREENLLYFTSMSDLRSYFARQDKTGCCVAILYQFRDCCIRTGRNLTAKAKLHVTDDLEKTGDTYCTTNDVRTWTTYRPYYKLYSTMEGMPDSQGGVYHLQDITYQFNWADVHYADNAYGAVLPLGSVYMDKAGGNVVNDATGALYNDNRGGNVRARPSRFENGYVKTEYRGGNKVNGTHTGALSGNTLLLYTLDTSISMSITTREEGTNAAKTEYTITKGEREVAFQIKPGIHISSGSKNVELVTNGTQKTAITITLDLPEGLTYKDGTINFDYDGCEYEDGDLQWDIDPSNPRKIILKTAVSDIEKGLPTFTFTCRIGDAEDPDKDIKINGTSLPVVSSIEAVYEEHSLIAAQTHKDTTTIRVLLDSKNGIYKDVGNQVLEVGDDIVYTLTYADSTLSKSANVQIVDVLPYNGDPRATQFTGGYRVKSVTLRFTGTTGSDNYQTFMNSGFLAYSDGHVCAGNDIPKEKALLESLKNSNTKFNKVGNGTNTVTFTPDSPLIQRADETDGIALYGYLPSVRSDSRFTVTITLSPLNADSDRALITDANGKTQSGGQSYGNDFFYQPNDSDPARSNAVHVRTVNRVISGMVWLDDDKDGLFDSAERHLKYVDAYLYTASTDGSGNPVIGEPAKDVLGNQVPKCVTDENGAYRFDNLPEGSYIVVFQDDTEDSGGTRYETVKGTQLPIPFEHLTVTNLNHPQAVRGNKSVPVPVAETPYWMTSAHLYTVVTLPRKEHIPSDTYVSPNWNLGVYSAYSYELPKSGGTGTTLYTTGGALLIVCAAFLLLYNKHRRGKEDENAS